jgi:hypothetical protein
MSIENVADAREIVRRRDNVRSVFFMLVLVGNYI